MATPRRGWRYEEGGRYGGSRHGNDVSWKIATRFSNVSS